MEYASLDSAMTIGVGFYHDTATHRAAACMADKSFAAVDVPFDSHPNDNLEGIIFDNAQAGFLAGYMAGLVAAVSPNKKAGILSGPRIAPVVEFTTGFSNAVAEACPECAPTELVVCNWAMCFARGAGETCPGETPEEIEENECTTSAGVAGCMTPAGFGSVPCGLEKSKQLLAMGVDVIFGAGGFTGTVGIEYAAAPKGTIVYGTEKTEAATPYVVGVDADEYLTTFAGGLTPGADKIITSALKKVDVGVRTAIGNYFGGAAVGRNFLMNAANGGVGFAPAHQASVVTAEMTTKVEVIETAMKLGTHSTRVAMGGACIVGPGPGCPAASPPPPGAPGIVFDAGVDMDGNPIIYECGSLIGESGVLSGCKAEEELLEESRTYPGCELANPAHKVTLVTTEGSNLDDGTFNSLAMVGAAKACTKENSCCLEVDMPTDTANDYFCELEYASLDSSFIVGVGFLHDAATHRAAACMASKSFAAVDVAFGSHPNENLEGIVFDDAQAGFLAGYLTGQLLATMATKKAGIVGGPAIPPVARFTTGYMNGVAEACPECAPTKLITCGFETGGFNAPECALAAAKELIADGTSVIFGAGGYTGSMAIMYAAAPKGTSTPAGVKAETTQTFVVGVDSDEYVTTFEGGAKAGADKIITSALKKVDVGVQTAIGNYFVGSAVGRNFILNVANGGIGYAPAHQATEITTAMKAATDEVKAGMAAGSFSTRTSTLGVCTAPPGPGCPEAAAGDGGNTTLIEVLADQTPAIIGGAVGGVLGGLLILGLIVCICCMVNKEKAGKPMFSNIEATPTGKPGAGAV